jgi:hypothetical protein
MGVPDGLPLYIVWQYSLRLIIKFVMSKSKSGMVYQNIFFERNLFKDITSTMDFNSGLLQIQE